MKLFYSYSILALLLVLTPNLLAQETEVITTPIETVEKTIIETETVAVEKTVEKSLDLDAVIMADLDEEFTESDSDKNPEILDKSELEDVAFYYRHHKRLPAVYNGFAIELTTSDLPLKRNYFLFNQFGNVSVEKLREGGYAYVVKVDFIKKETLESFIKNIILHRAPEAKAIEYVDGVRKAE